MIDILSEVNNYGLTIGSLLDIWRAMRDCYIDSQ